MRKYHPGLVLVTSHQACHSGKGPKSNHRKVNETQRQATAHQPELFHQRPRSMCMIKQCASASRHERIGRSLSLALRAFQIRTSGLSLMTSCINLNHPCLRGKDHVRPTIQSRSAIAIREAILNRLNPRNVCHSTHQTACSSTREHGSLHQSESHMFPWMIIIKQIESQEQIISSTTSSGVIE